MLRGSRRVSRRGDAGDRRCVLGLDTVDANLRLGFRADEREYGDAAAILEAIRVVERMPLEIPVTDHTRGYLALKRLRMGDFPEELAR